MSADSKKPGRSAPEKRVLWEVRQRYHIDPVGSSRPSSKKRSGRASSSVPTTKRTASTGRSSNQRSLVRKGLSNQPRQRASITTPPPGTYGKRGGSGGGGHPPTLRAPSGGTGRWVKRFLLLIVLLALIGGGVFGYKVISASNRISTADRSLLGQLKDLLFSQGKQLEGETEGRINILLMAIGGEGHKGRNLADTIMLASVRPEDNAVALLSIPRDMYVQVPGESYYSKINAVHAYGEQLKRDQGPETLREAVEDITGQTIHYYGRVDFTAFKEIVDTVGGINITIDNEFFDYWHKISFPAGTEQMDGERALAFVRARYIEGPEGGDFKRAGRQQQVLLSLRDKVFSVNTALDFTALNNILNALSDNIRTDMHLWEMKRFYELARTIDGSNVKSVVLTTGPKGVLVGETEILGDSPASVLKPRTGNYDEIRALADELFSTDQTVTASNGAPRETVLPPPEEEESKEIEKPSVEIRNGTTITGLASRTSDELTSQGYEVIAIGNAAQRDLTSTTVYIVDDAFTDGARALADEMGFGTDSGKPADEADTEAGALIVLGADADESE